MKPTLEKNHPHLVVVLNPEDIRAYVKKDASWKPMRLRGEEVLTESGPVQRVLSEINNNLNEGNLSRWWVDVLLSTPRQSEAGALISELQRMEAVHWQILSLPRCLVHLQKRHPTQDPVTTAPAEQQWYLDRLLPALDRQALALDEASPRGVTPARAAKTAVPPDLQQALAQLTAQNQQYQQQIQYLHAELEQRQHSPQRAREQLLSFLPVIFKNFWHQVSPQTVATLMGTVEVPQISSPFIQPDEPTVLAKKRQFERLPSAEQQVIWSFCAQLDYHHLDMHPQFQSAFRQWQEQQP